jgi:hypothetical protein
MKNIFTYILLLLLYLCLNSCNNCERFSGENYPADNPEDSAIVPMLNRIFDQLSEPDISGSDSQVYRLMISSSFEKGMHCVIKITKTADGCTLKAFNYESRYTDGKPVHSKTEEVIRKLSLEKWNTFEDLVYASKYWTMPCFEHKMSLDGVLYYLEASRPQAGDCGKKTYQAVARKSPAPDDLFLFVCEWMLHNSVKN